MCSGCSRPLDGTLSFVLSGQPKCWRCALRDWPLLRRSLLTALVVGAILTAINQGTTIADGEFPAALWWKFALLGVFSTLVPFRCFYAGLKRLPAAEAGILATAEPVVAIVSAYVFLGESLGPWQLAGAGMVIVAAVLASRGQPDAGEGIAERG